MRLQASVFVSVYTISLFLFPIEISAAPIPVPTSTSPTTNATDVVPAPPPKNTDPQATVFFSPSSQTVLEGSTFDVSVYLNTHKTSINALEVLIRFPPSKLQIVSPSAGKSLIQLWLSPPSYSQTDGTIRFVGIIPNGVVTQSGLLSTITFKALANGEANLSIAPSSKILINDGQGTVAFSELGRATYTITPQPPAGVSVFSDTHRFESTWYQNKNAVLSWDKEATSTEFSYVLDDKPSTIPDDVVDSSSTSMSSQKLTDGLNYFHIKANNRGIWGPVTHFLLRIDTLPPAAFQPGIDVVGETDISRYLISFLTTDSLSGIDHYEVAVIDKTESATISPVFIQAESPYQLSNPSSHPLRVIVRAVDGAGNTRDQSVDINVAAASTLSAKSFNFLQAKLVLILSGILIFILLMLIFHYLFGHRIYSRLKEVSHLMEHEEEIKKIEQELHAAEAVPSEPKPPNQDNSQNPLIDG